jgi:hypothetical protein
MNKLNKIIASCIAVGTLFVLASCTAKYEDATGKYPSKPESLKDCIFTELHDVNGNKLTIVRCPNSQTSTIRAGKHPEQAVVIEDTIKVIEDSINVNGVEYIKK